MEPNKFEKHIKKKLDGRTIEPSVEAWKKLSNQLGVVKQPKKKKYAPYWIAASFIGILIVSVLYFNVEDKLTAPSIQVVDIEKEAIEKTISIDEIQEKINENAVVKINENEQKEIENKLEDQRQVFSSKKQVIAVEDIEIVLEETTLPKNSEEIINIKILEIAAQVDLLEQSNSALTDAEVDSLLRKAQKEILANKIFIDYRSVDAMALLTEVENELDQSFRDQIFETLKTGFVKVRTAVADRNN